MIWIEFPQHTDQRSLVIAAKNRSEMRRMPNVSYLNRVPLIQVSYIQFQRDLLLQVLSSYVRVIPGILLIEQYKKDIRKNERIDGEYIRVAYQVIIPDLYRKTSNLSILDEGKPNGAAWVMTHRAWIVIPFHGETGGSVCSLLCTNRHPFR